MITVTTHGDKEGVAGATLLNVCTAVSIALHSAADRIPSRESTK